MSWAADAGYLVPEAIPAHQAGVTSIDADESVPA
jgi:hypothetical protein